MKSQFKLGAVVSYLNIVLNIGISIFLTPFLIKSLGNSEYGVYKIIQSFAGQLSIMSFGIATLTVRYIVYYDTRGEKEEKENFLFFSRIITFILAALMITIGGVMYSMIDKMYGTSLSPQELHTAKVLMIFLVLNLALSVVCDSYTGIITAHEHFVVSHGSKTVKFIFRTVLILLLLKMGVKSIGVVVADCAVTFIVLLIVFIYGKAVLKEKAVFHHTDKKLFRDCLTFAVAIFLQTIVNQVNLNLDNVILGVMTSAECVTIYSVGLTIFTTFNTMVSTIGCLYSPRATRLVAGNASGEELTDFIIGPGRYQLMIAGLAISGFVLLGKDFLILWVGEDFLPMYSATVWLLVSSIIPLVETVSEAILDALMKRLGRSLILIAMCIMNIGISVFCINKMGYTGAAVGTAVSFIIGHGILLNIYLYKVARINIFRLFKEIFSRITPAILISVAVGFPISLLGISGWLGFLCKAVMFAVVYCVIVYFIGMRKEEKQFVLDTVKPLLHIKGKKQT